jgi:restriction system protein
MPYPIARLIEGRKPPICIAADQNVRDALEIMLGRDYNQLPVIDSAGCLKGVISEQTILRTYYHSNGKVSLLDLPVTHCQETIATLTPDDDLIDALDLLHDRDNYAIVIVADQRPIAILTHFDITQVFRDVSLNQILIEDVELTLRRYIETAFPDEEAMRDAMIATFGADKKDPTKPVREYQTLGFFDHIRIITEQKNWPHFASVLEPQELFWALMNQVRTTRNQLAHFRGRPSEIQRDGLKAATDWLTTRPPLTPPPQEPTDAQSSGTLNEGT